MAKRFWLFKSEPSVFSFDDLLRSPEQTTAWEGVRNYQARSYLRDQVRPGDGVLFYHSSEEPMAVVGTAVVASEPYPDPTQFDPQSSYYDAGARREEPRWYLVDVRAERRFAREVTLEEIKRTKELEGMLLVKKGMRLSIQPVTPEEWDIIVKLGGG